MKKAKLVFIGIIVGLVFGLWFGVNIGKEKPLFSNPFAKGQIKTTIKESGEKVLEKSGKALEQTGKAIQEQIQKDKNED
ncbi:MAG: hypothetical protein AB1610_09205 [Nitrospirota bacterium]